VHGTAGDVRAPLAGIGVGKQNWLERLVVLPALPLGTGGKVHRASLRPMPRSSGLSVAEPGNLPRMRRAVVPIGGDWVDDKGES